MKSPNLGLLLCSLIFIPLVTPAQESTAVTGLTSNPAFQKNCAKCHGKTAKGRFMGGPGLASAKVRALSDDDLRNIIANGKGHMPKYAGKLTPEEIDTLIHEVRMLNTK